MTESKTNFDANGEALITDPIDGATYPASYLKGKYSLRKWERYGISRATVIEQGGYHRVNGGDGKWVPVPRAYIDPSYPITTGQKKRVGRPKKAKPSSATEPGTTPLVNSASFDYEPINLIEQLSQDTRVLGMIRKHADSLGWLSRDLEDVPLFDPMDNNTEDPHGSFNNYNVSKMHPQARMLWDLIRKRNRIYADKESTNADRSTYDKMVLTVMSQVYGRLDTGVRDLFKVMASLDKIKEAADRIDGKAKDKKRLSKTEYDKKLELARSLGIADDFIEAEVVPNE